MEETIEIVESDYVICFENKKEITRKLYLALDKNEIRFKTDKLWLIHLYTFILSLEGVRIINNLENQ